jgi:hypothetical protein
MLDLRLAVAVVEAGSEPALQPDPAIGCAERESSPYRRRTRPPSPAVSSASMTPAQLATFDHFMTERVAATLCRHPGGQSRPSGSHVSAVPVQGVGARFVMT